MGEVLSSVFIIAFLLWILFKIIKSIEERKKKKESEILSKKQKLIQRIIDDRMKSLENILNSKNITDPFNIVNYNIKIKRDFSFAWDLFCPPNHINPYLVICVNNSIFNLNSNIPGFYSLKNPPPGFKTKNFAGHGPFLKSKVNYDRQISILEKFKYSNEKSTEQVYKILFYEELLELGYRSLLHGHIELNENSKKPKNDTEGNIIIIIWVIIGLFISIWLQSLGLNSTSSYCLGFLGSTFIFGLVIYLISLIKGD